MPNKFLEIYPIKEIGELNSFPEGVPNWEQFEEWTKSIKLTDRHHGTYRNKERSLFCYIKPSWSVESFHLGQKATQILYFLRDKELFHPSCEFRLITNHENKFQVIAFMKGIEEWDKAKNGVNGRQMIKQNIGERNMYSGQFDSDSHILEWLRRLDPTIDEETLQSQPLYPLLSSVHTEGSHSDNWGWDLTTGKAYPTDMEIFSLSSPHSDIHHQGITSAINGWQPEG